MSEVFDASLPELSERDPRLCPGSTEWEADTEMYPEGPPDWMGPAPYTGPHDWTGWSTSGCHWCHVQKADVRERFRDWRYEQLVKGLTKSIDALTAAIERKNW